MLKCPPDWLQRDKIVLQGSQNAHTVLYRTPFMQDNKHTSQPSWLSCILTSCYSQKSIFLHVMTIFYTLLPFFVLTSCCWATNGFYLASEIKVWQMKTDDIFFFYLISCWRCKLGFLSTQSCPQVWMRASVCFLSLCVSPVGNWRPSPFAQIWDQWHDFFVQRFNSYYFFFYFYFIFFILYLLSSYFYLLFSVFDRTLLLTST